MLTGTNLKYTKAYNYRIVLETIRLHSPLSRADIARHTSLTAQTVSNIVKRLIDAELIREADKRREGRGAPSITLEINPDGAYSIGLDLDKDHLTGVLVDLSGNVLERVHYELSFPSPDEAIDLMTETVDHLKAQQDLDPDRIGGIGIGFPGPIEITKDNIVTNIVNPKAFPGWKHVPVVDLMSERIDLPILLENNATAAAVGERWYGAGQYLSTFFYMLFGVGLGGGVIINGHPYEGHSGNAGELGYLLPPDYAPENKSAPTHLGEYFNLPRLYEVLRNDGIEISQPYELLPPYERRNEHLMEWLNTATRHLATLILAVEHLIDPEVIFFGGRYPKPILADMMARLEERLPTLRSSGKSVVPELKHATAGEDAAALGVATLPIYDFFAPAPSLLMKNNRTEQNPSLMQHLSS